MSPETLNERYLAGKLTERDIYEWKMVMGASSLKKEQHDVTGIPLEVYNKLSDNPVYLANFKDDSGKKSCK